MTTPHFVGVLILTRSGYCLLYNFVVKHNTRFQSNIQRLHKELHQFLPLPWVNPAELFPSSSSAWFTLAVPSSDKCQVTMQDGWKQLRPCWLQTHQLVWQCMPYWSFSSPFFYTFVQDQSKKTQKTFKRVVPISQAFDSSKDRRVYVSFATSFSKRRIRLFGFITIIPILAWDLFGLTDAKVLEELVC